MTRKIQKSKLIDFAMGKLTPEESLSIIEMLEKDPVASRELEVISGILNIAALEGQEAFKKVESETTSKYPRFLDAIVDFADQLRERRIAYPLLGFSSVVLAIVGLVVASRLATGRYYELTQIERPEFEVPVRGQEEVDFGTAQRLYSQGKFDESIHLMERYIRAFPEGDMIDYAHYSAGAMHLLSSQQSFLSLFPSFDRRKILTGMEHLQQAIVTTRNARIAEDALWLRAKGYLMLDSADEAVGELSKIERLNGMRKDSASQLIARIRILQRGG